MALQVGTRITQGPDEYLLEEELSSGGYGKVFRATRVKPDNLPVAVKVPHPHVLADQLLFALFLREVRILANLKHTNIVKILSFFKFASGEVAFAQELVAGAKKLHEYTPANPDEVASTFLQALYGMRAFHGGQSNHAAIHRDLSPNNILVDQNGLVKIIDFGFAKEDPRKTVQLTQVGNVAGTQGCIAPEQITDYANVDHRADLYALGRTLTACLQGRSPIHADPAMLPEPWKTICVKLTQFDRNHRYQTADDAIEEALLLFGTNGVSISRFEIHINEMDAKPVTSGWGVACNGYFNSLANIDFDGVRLLRRIDPAVFTIPGFVANQLFDKLEGSTAIAYFSQSFINFDYCDPVGNLYASLYPGLDAPRREKCFKRLCDLAIDWHRYAVMEAIRAAYKAEQDAVIQTKLMAILDAKDPTKIVEGRGVLPGR